VEKKHFAGCEFGILSEEKNSTKHKHEVIKLVGFSCARADPFEMEDVASSGSGCVFFIMSSGGGGGD